MKNVKIIVLRKGFYPDLIREHLTEPPEECVCDFFGVSYPDGNPVSGSDY